MRLDLASGCCSEGLCGSFAASSWATYAGSATSFGTSSLSDSRTTRSGSRLYELLVYNLDFQYPVYLCGPCPLLVASRSVAYTRQSETCTRDPACVSPLATGVRDNSGLKERGYPYRRPCRSRYEQRVLHGLVNIRDGSEDDEQQWREQLVILGDVISDERDSRVHGGEAGYRSLAGMELIGVVVRMVRPADAEEAEMQGPTRTCTSDVPRA
jgi:hypothetical protein